MTDCSALIAKLEALGLGDAPIEHVAAENVEQWAEVLAGASGVPPGHALTKTLIFKPKQPKSEPVAPVMVVIRSDTNASSKAIGQALGLKDLRLANEDVLSEIFQTSRGSGKYATGGRLSPFALGNVAPDHLANVRVVLDKALLGDSARRIAFHPLTNTRTVFVDAACLRAFVASVAGLKQVVELDFDAAPEAAAPAAAAKAKKPAAAEEDAAADEATGSARLGIEASKDKDFAKWYRQVILRSEMLDNYSVSGCYILRPTSYFVWEEIQKFLDAGIRAMGVRNCYFPMFVAERDLNKEKDHIEGFAPEVAWVTRAGSSEMAAPIAIRPTSETVMYPYYANWIRSWRDLPLRLNQWNSVVRWEFKNPQPFLRTREFLWQEGHCAYLTRDEAWRETLDILALYRRVYEELLAVPVVEGVKSEKEKFAGGVATTTVEGFIPATGRGIQAGTSHYLGQNFSKMFDIVVEDPDPTKPKIHAHQTSWGLSTRAIGVMVMTHSDDKGLLLPPRVAETQVIIVPSGLGSKNTPEEHKRVADTCLAVEARLRRVGVRAASDLRDGYTPGFKFSHWELRGVPLRLEIGPRDLEKQSVLSVRRDTFEKAPLPLDGLETAVELMLHRIQDELLIRARATMKDRIKTVMCWDDFVPTLNRKCIAQIPWCEREECEEQIKARSTRDALQDEPEDEKEPSMGAKSLCLPLQQPQDHPIVPGQTKCIQCGQDAKRYALFGRSY
ncbi:hypothetical protein H4R18_001907 [Coemansia javaensis]|uniref:proline--tRNA ligase n=1 Tax=Coemansia javaensis TaxID=2761396 RepID=A0A9W8HDJ4_9FUNG|nr:hypothetical protein H4R18_001907 [Coemansia javaensis]